MEELPEDRRTKTVDLRKKEKRAEEIISRVQESERNAMGKLTAEQREMLLSLTRTYINSCREDMKNG